MRNQKKGPNLYVYQTITLSTTKLSLILVGPFSERIKQKKKSVCFFLNQALSISLIPSQGCYFENRFWENHERTNKPEVNEFIAPTSLIRWVQNMDYFLSWLRTARMMNRHVVKECHSVLSAHCCCCRCYQVAAVVVHFLTITNT